jgi:hypothetical protein
MQAQHYCKKGFLYMKTLKQARVSEIHSRLTALGLADPDLYRVSRRLSEGTYGDTEGLIEILARNCQHSDLYCKVRGDDLVLYGLTGYAIVDSKTCEIQYCLPYSPEETLDRATAHMTDQLSVLVSVTILSL